MAASLVFLLDSLQWEWHASGYFNCSWDSSSFRVVLSNLSQQKGFCLVLLCLILLCLAVVSWRSALFRRLNGSGVGWIWWKGEMDDIGGRRREGRANWLRCIAWEKNLFSLRGWASAVFLLRHEREKLQRMYYWIWLQKQNYVKNNEPTAGFFLNTCYKYSSDLISLH